MNYTGKQNDFSFCCKKITFCTQLCLLIIGLLASAFSIEAVAQNKPITLKLDNATVVEAVRAVEKQSTYKFVYNNADVDVSRKISVNIENATVETAAKTIFAGYNVTIKGKNVIITSPKKAGTNAKQQSSHRSKVIGAVVDAVTGDPLTGASVLVKNATPPYGVTADADGKFELSVSPDDVLVVSFIGYLSQEVKIGNRKILSISLSEDATALGEVVVTAFNMGQKKATMTGSIQTLRPSDLKVPATNLSTAFAGRLSGVIAYQRSGEPGSNGADFFVRGVSTMSGATNPLIILDGVEVSKADLDALDPEVIEGFSVLKDATASAMYGTRGANGVLIIKTKSGANLDKPVISVRVEGYVNKPINVPQVVSPVMFMRMFNEAVTNQGTDALLYSEDK
ncbi:TonB-dependent receptor plug domain-containing protein, partial [Bacteroides heparinolyticus]